MEIWKCNFRCFVCSYVFILCLNSFVLAENHTQDPSLKIYSPLIPCYLLPREFVVCNQPTFEDETNTNSTDFQCPATSRTVTRYSAVLHVAVLCTVVDETIECSGNRSFEKENFPCVRYTGHCFVTVLLQSVFLGCLGIDRFSLGYCGEGVGKLLTLGGVGFWWIADVIMLLTGNLTPSDGSNWCNFY